MPHCETGRREWGGDLIFTLRVGGGRLPVQGQAALLLRPVSRSQGKNGKNNKDSDTVSQFKLSEDQMRNESYTIILVYIYCKLSSNVNHFSSEKAATKVYNTIHRPSPKKKKKKNFHETQTKLSGLSLISFALCISTKITGKFFHCCSIDEWPFCNSSGSLFFSHQLSFFRFIL